MPWFRSCGEIRIMPQKTIMAKVWLSGDKPISQVLEEIHVLPDFSTGRSDSLNLMYIHKRAGDADVYFVFNQQDRELSRECLFSAGNKIPEIWDPQEGTVTMPAIYQK